MARSAEGIEALVTRGVLDPHHFAGARHVPGEAALQRLAQRGQLRQERDARHEITVLGIAEPDGRPVGAQRARQALACGAQELIEVDLACEEAGEIDEQG